MEPLLDAKALERRIWRSFHEDGLLELLAGCFFLGLALYASSRGDSPWIDGLAGLSGLGGVLVWWCGKRFLTAPRAGLVRLGPRGAQRLVKGVAILAASILLSLGMLALGRGEQGTGAISPVFRAGGLVGAQALLVLGFLAWFLDHPRFYGVAILAASAFLVRGWLVSKGLPGATLAFLAPALLMLLTGLVMLLRFLRHHPLEGR